MDYAIKFLTHGKGCHAAFLRSDNVTIHEAFYPRVRDRKLLPSDMRSVECYRLDGLSVDDHARFERLFDANLKLRIEYSILDLFRYAFNRPSRDEHHTFCSRYVMHCLQAVLHGHQMPLVRLPYRDWASPRDLRLSPLLLRCRIDDPVVLSQVVPTETPPRQGQPG